MISGFIKSFFLAVSISWISSFLIAILKFIRIPIIISALGVDLLGFWTTLLGISGIVFSFEYIFTSIITKLITLENNNLENRISTYQKNKRLINYFYTRFSSLILVFYLFISFLVLFFTNPEVSFEVQLITIFLIFLSSWGYLFSTKYFAIIDSFNQVWFSRLAKGLYEVLGLLALIIFLTIIENFLILGVCLLLQTIFLFLFTRKYLDNYLKNFQENEKIHKASKYQIDLDLYRTLKEDFYKISKIQLTSLITLLMPTVLIPIFYDYKIMAQYSLLQQLAQVGILIINPILISYFPKLIEEKSISGEHYFKDLSIFLFSIIVCLYLFIFLFLDQIFLIWTNGTIYSDISLSLVLFLVSSFEISYLILRQACLSKKKLVNFSHISLKGIIFYIPFLVLFVLVDDFLSLGPFMMLLPSLFTILFIFNFSLYKTGFSELSGKESVKLALFTLTYVILSFACIYLVLAYESLINNYFLYGFLIFLIFIIYLILLLDFRNIVKMIKLLR